MAITMGQLASRYAAASKKLPGSTELKQLAQVGVGLVKKEIQKMHAVDTGTMLNSTTADQAGQDTYLVGPTVDYAVFVAEGTSRVAARPFHRAATSELRKRASEIGFNPDDLGI